MPTFSYEWDTSLRDTLSAMGMPLAFSGGADFSGMTGNRALFIDDVLHKAFVAVDEEGTEAAAATAVIMREAAPRQPASPIEFTVDRPFIFLIRDRATGTILFIGRFLDPSA
jgi:serpin B